jgi:RNA-splicing ligase RtcB
MIELKGKYSTAKVFTDFIEKTAQQQIIELCDQEFTEDCKIRIMPDCHAGAGCVIGFTADLKDKVIPNLVGVDIGCGMYVIELGKIDIDLPKLDEVIRQHIPAGTKTHKNKITSFSELEKLCCYNGLKNLPRIENSLGTLGGGNHFIEGNREANGNTYIVIHSGSRNLGKQVADIYQKLAIEACSTDENYHLEKEALVEKYKRQGRGKEIQPALEALKKKHGGGIKDSLCYLTGDLKERYLHDMGICQYYATRNREIMAEIIIDKMSLNCNNSFHTVHNYIDFNDNIIRKGSVSAYNGEKIIIPINMRDGSIIAIGKGNPDWNYSAPHGAGRLMSRGQAKKNITLEEFEKSMEGIYTTSVDESTLDESPMSYKPKEEIIKNIWPTAEIESIISPIYNFKFSEGIDIRERRQKLNTLSDAVSSHHSLKK